MSLRFVIEVRAGAFLLEAAAFFEIETRNSGFRHKIEEKRDFLKGFVCCIRNGHQETGRSMCRGLEEE